MVLVTSLKALTAFSDIELPFSLLKHIEVSRPITNMSILRADWFWIPYGGSGGLFLQIFFKLLI